MSASIDVVAPYDLSLIKTLPMQDAAAVEKALATASALERQPLPKAERIDILEKTIAVLKRDRDRLIRDAAQEGGKPFNDSAVEIDRGIQGIINAIDELRAMAGQEIPMGHTSSSTNRLAFTTREPIGTCVAISAFNHPFNLIVHQVVPAIATGCPVIVKPATSTPLSCYNLVAALYEAGLPEERCQVILLNNADSEALVTDSRVKFFSFIGSAKVGWYLRSKLAPGTRCALEHGGVAPVIACADAALDKNLIPLVKGGYYHAGQVCVSVQRLFCHKSRFAEFAEAIGAAAKNLKVGDPLEASTEVGPLILPQEVDRVASWVEEAKKGGATVAAGGQRISDTCFEPTLLLNPPQNAKVTTNEVFGPVVCMYEYDDVDDAIQQANSLPWAFQASVLSQDIDQALKVTKALDAAAVMINDHTAFRVDWMPFAGRRSSGLGIGGIPHTMHDMTQDKLIVMRSPEL